MMENRTRTFWCAAQQCFFGSIALALVTIVCFRLKADLPTTAFVYLAVIVLLSLIGSYFASVVLIVLAIAGLIYFFNPPVFSSAIDLPQDQYRDVRLRCAVPRSPIRKNAIRYGFHRRRSTTH